MENIPEFKAAVEISRKWDGKEVAEEIVNKIKNKNINPRFILLFTTIHYEKEFKKLLSEIKNEFPNIPLVGGTVAGFMTHEGCFTRGVTAFACDYQNLRISIGIGHETKKDPKKAAKEFAQLIKNNETSSPEYKKFLFMLSSGTKVPSLTGTGVKRVYKSKISSIMVTKLLKTAPRISNRGLGREDIILEEISKHLPNYKIIGGSSLDDNKLEKNFQFFNDNIYSNSVIGIAIESDLDIIMDSHVAVEKTDLIFNISTTDEKCIINKIDEKPATETFFQYLRWPDSLKDERLFRRTFFYPLIFEKDGEIYPEVIGGLAGNSIICGFDIKSDTLCIGQSSSKILNNVLTNSLKNITSKSIPKFSLIIYCSALLEALGIDFFKVQKKIKDAHEDSPFLLIATGGEDFYIPNKILKHSNETINFAAFVK
jgi:hypothetical protein